MPCRCNSKELIIRWVFADRLRKNHCGVVASSDQVLEDDDPIDVHDLMIMSGKAKQLAEGEADKQTREATSQQTS